MTKSDTTAYRKQNLPRACCLASARAASARFCIFLRSILDPVPANMACVSESCLSCSSSPSENKSFRSPLRKNRLCFGLDKILFVRNCLNICLQELSYIIRDFCHNPGKHFTFADQNLILIFRQF